MGLSLSVLLSLLPPSLAVNCFGMDILVFESVIFSRKKKTDEFKDRLVSLTNPCLSSPVQTCVSPVILLQDAGQNPTDTLMGKVNSPPSVTSSSTTRTTHYATVCAEGKYTLVT